MIGTSEGARGGVRKPVAVRKSHPPPREPPSTEVTLSASGTTARMDALGDRAVPVSGATIMDASAATTMPTQALRRPICTCLRRPGLVRETQSGPLRVEGNELASLGILVRSVRGVLEMR